MDFTIIYFFKWYDEKDLKNILHWLDLITYTSKLKSSGSFTNDASPCFKCGNGGNQKKDFL